MNAKDNLALQFVPALVGSGDSVHFSWTPEVRSTYSGTNWTDYRAADTVSSALGDTDALYEFQQFNYLQVRFICTGISTDTVLVTLYSVLK
jgi:hypothetical protein